ncbi:MULTISPECIES: penicillin-insensitive murein endopeptidase [Methylomonas]|uniref:penicillin-insensitive murein endopeptidase n=1 Tax=Methylomonas TaxID=416 RepID=UPI0012327C07|nr:penicillin-insensitive murein endopeptidase [Methylomonas rhizoryzae]
MNKLVLCLIAAGFSANCAARSEAEIWAKVAAPTKSARAESIGSYTNGCLRGAQALPVTGVGYQVMRLSRNRFYGHPDLVRYIQDLGAFASGQKLGTLLVGDLGQPRGGPTVSGHKSHQTGLDVDMWFLLPNNLESRVLSSQERESWGAPSMLDAHNAVDFGRWTQAHEQLLETAARDARVERIFVNPAIKQALCNDKARFADSAWLRKIRPWWKHDDHFHVRLKCPGGSDDCSSQEAVPAGDGCGADLAWWFSAEALAPQPAAKPSVKPPLPAKCAEVLSQP